MICILCNDMYYQYCILHVVVYTLYSVEEMQQLLSDDDKLDVMIASRIDEVNDVQQKIVLFLEKFAS